MAESCGDCWTRMDKHIIIKSDQLQISSNSFPKRKKIVDISTVTEIEEAKKLIRSGWEYKTVFPATLQNIPHYVLVKRE